jgi:hypothetical protein
LQNHEVGKETYLFLACTYFFRQQFEEAEKAAKLGPEVPLKNRCVTACNAVMAESHVLLYHNIDCCSTFIIEVATRLN